MGKRLQVTEMRAERAFCPVKRALHLAASQPVSTVRITKDTEPVLPAAPRSQRLESSQASCFLLLVRKQTEI